MPVSKEPKYIFNDGVMELNPKYVPDDKAGEAKTTVAKPKEALAIVSSMEDIGKANEAKKEGGNPEPVKLSNATVSSLRIMQDSDYSNRFEAPRELSSGELVDGLTKYFSQYEVPLGLVNKLLALIESKLNFIIDDSGSMSLNSDTMINDASSYVKKERDPSGHRTRSSIRNLKRWEEAEDRLHIFMDMLSYVPTGKLTFRFLNNEETMTLEHTGKTPDQFQEEAHKKISALFKRVQPSGGTPLLGALQSSLQEAKEDERVMQYILTDGEPQQLSSVKDLVLNRKNPNMTPITFLSCTNQDREAKWMKDLEEVAPFTSEVDDFNDERDEVLHDQGATFPYSKGFWLLCQMVAAINPDDLDAMDEERPFSKKTMDNLMGRKLTAEEFKKYFDGHPLGQKKDFSALYSEFSKDDVNAPNARQILEKHRPDLLKLQTDSSSRFSFRR